MEPEKQTFRLKNCFDHKFLSYVCIEVSAMDRRAVVELVPQSKGESFHKNMPRNFADVEFKELCTVAEPSIRHETSFGYSEVIA